MDSRLLPEGFVSAYETLVSRALNDGSGMDGHAVSESSEGRGGIGKADGSGGIRWRNDSGQSDTVGGGGYGRAIRGKAQVKVVGKTSRGMRDERLWRVRVLVDKRLRQMGREIAAALEGVDTRIAGRRICGGRCRRLGQTDWNFCPNCGGQMREMDSGEKVSDSA